MTRITDVASKCVDDLKTKLESLAKLKGKAFWVYNEDHLMDKTKGITFPAVGVVYEGIRAVSENQKDTYKVGFSGELVASIMVIQRPDTISSADTKNGASLWRLRLPRRTVWSSGFNAGVPPFN